MGKNHTDDKFHSKTSTLKILVFVTAYATYLKSKLCVSYKMSRYIVNIKNKIKSKERTKRRYTQGHEINKLRLKNNELMNTY